MVNEDLFKYFKNLDADLAGENEINDDIGDIQPPWKKSSKFKRQALPSTGDSQIVLGTFQAMMRPMSAPSLPSLGEPKPGYLLAVHQVITMTRIPGDCYVAGALALILRVSRLLGMAPMKMTHESGRWRVTTSAAACFYSFFVIIGLHTLSLLGLAYDFSLEEKDAVRVRSTTSAIVWCIELTMILSITTFGLFEAPARVKEIIECLNVIQKVHIKSINVEWLKLTGENKRYISIFIYLLLVYTMISVRFIDFWMDGKNATITHLYGAYYVEFFIVVVLEMQFFSIAMHINYALKFVNDSLYGLICILDLKSPELPVKRAQEKVRSLMLSFGAICDVMRKISGTYENILLLFAASFFFHLVTTPYYLVGNFFSPNKDIIGKLLLKIIFLVLHISLLVIAVEPGHRLKKELERTSVLVSQLLRRVSSPRDSLSLELDLFDKQIALNRVSYSPMEITLARPLITAICGGVTTYLIIILQFQSLVAVKVAVAQSQLSCPAWTHVFAKERQKKRLSHF
ncbi:7tm chemosensory receptor domain-containing protein [Phthorimaea operculella]|nr:7tm chemosensory receptor domain-containing protein [Phthorimaea operculella]